MKNTDNLEFDSKGRLLLTDSHHSANKTYGGVQNVISLDRNGNVFSLIADENDLFKLNLASGDRMLTVTRPSYYNLFGDEAAFASKAKSAVKGDAQRATKNEILGTGRQDIAVNLANEVLNNRAPVRVRDIAASAPVSVPAAGGLIQALNEEGKQ